MANIQPQIDQIRSAKFGRDVRESIATGLEAMNSESSTAYSAAITAQNSASNSASQAAQSATDASNSASSASDSANRAAEGLATITSAVNTAEAAKLAAEKSASDAKTSETNAKASETASKSSESNAKASENSAQSYAQNAQSASSQAQQYAANANTSAVSAQNSQTSAGISATNAKTSEDAAKAYAEQAKAIAKIDIATSTTPGIVKPDGTTTVVDQFGAMSVKGLSEHIADTVYSDTSSADGVHGIRVRTDEVSGVTSMQRWNTETSSWENIISNVEADDESTEIVNGQMKVKDYAQIKSDINTLSETKADKTEVALKANVSSLSNSNLLDNPFFDFCPNGTYAQGSYGIPNWIVYDGTVIKTDDGLTMINGVNGYCLLGQKIKEADTSLNGKTLTMSVIFTDGTVVQGTNTFVNKDTYVGFYSTPELMLDYENSANIFRIVNTIQRSIKALKLEVGNVSTIANDLKYSSGNTLYSLTDAKDKIYGTSDKWDISKHYDVGDLTIFDSSLFECVVSHSGVIPTSDVSDTYWKKVSLAELKTNIDNLEYFKSGDTYNIKSDYVAAATINTAGTGFSISVICPKKITKINTISIKATQVALRQTNKADVILANVTFTVLARGDYDIQLLASVSGYTAKTPLVAVVSNLIVTFS